MANIRLSPQLCVCNPIRTCCCILLQNCVVFFIAMLSAVTSIHWQSCVIVVSMSCGGVSSWVGNMLVSTFSCGRCTQDFDIMPIAWTLLQAETWHVIPHSRNNINVLGCLVF